MTDEDLTRLEGYARAASGDAWQWAHTPTATRLGAIWWLVRLILKHRGSVVWGVVTGDGDAPPWVAITGNGPLSEANSAYLVAAQPVNILALIQEVRKARAE